MPTAARRARLRAMTSTAVTAPPLFTELRPPLDPERALLEAERCLECGGRAEAPCVDACPAEVDVPGFIGAIADGDPVGAADTIFASNLLGATCARVCPVEVLCQGACVLAHEGRAPVEIAALQRYATDLALAHRRPLRAHRAPLRHGRVAVVGAGPAGLACAGELAAAGFAVTVHDARPEAGGLVRFAIAPYRLQREPLPDEVRALEDLGVEFRLGDAIDSPEALRRLEADADALVLACGMGADTDVELPGADLPGVWRSLPFIEALKTGEPPAVGRSVAVIGGGNTAIDVVCEARRLGAAEVTLVYRRTEAEMPAYAHEVEEARREGVRFLWLTVPLRFLGTRRLEGLECRHVRLVPDEGRGRLEEVEGTEFVLPVETAVLGIGQQPRTELLTWIEGLELERGRPAVDAATGRTSNPRWWAAGDAVNGGATVVEAVHQAKLVAASIAEVLP